MLEGLDKIDWGSLQVYGSTRLGTRNPEDLPHLIHSLLSTDDEVRRESAYQLRTKLSDMGYPATAAVPCIPFLLELLQSDKVQKKARILYIFDVLLSSTLIDHYHYSQEYPPRFRTKFEVYEAAIVGLPCYISFLKHDDPLVRRITAQVLRHLTEFYKDILQNYG